MHAKYHVSVSTQDKKSQSASMRTAARWYEKVPKNISKCYESPNSRNSYVLAILSSTTTKNNTGSNNSGMVNYCQIFLDIKPKETQYLADCFCPPLLLNLQIPGPGRSKDIWLYGVLWQMFMVSEGVWYVWVFNSTARAQISFIILESISWWKLVHNLIGGMRFWISY